MDMDRFEKVAVPGWLKEMLESYQQRCAAA